MGAIVGILTAILNLAAFVCFIFVLIKLFKTKGLLHGLLGFFCGIYTFIWGWLHHREHEITKIMAGWSGCIVLGIILSVISIFSAANEAIKTVKQVTTPPIHIGQKPEVAKKPVAVAPEKEGITGVEILRYGLYNIEFEDRTIKNEIAHSGERIPFKKYEFIEQTDKIPAKIGNIMGFEYRLNGSPKGKPVLLYINFNVKEPKLIYEPGTENVLFDSVTNEETKIGDAQLVAYQIKKESDLISGIWTFTLLHEEKKLAEQVFKVKLKEE